MIRASHFPRSRNRLLTGLRRDWLSTARQTGQVLWYDANRGYGFIGTDGGDQYFVHQTAIRTSGFRSLKQSETVEFRIDYDDRGRTVAMDVTGPQGTAVLGSPRSPKASSSS